MLEAGKDFGRYRDLDGDGIPYRTLPGTHPKRGSFFTRGSSKDRYAKYTEEAAAYKDNMDRLLKKFDTAKNLVPQPIEHKAKVATKIGALYYGSTSPAMGEAAEILAADGMPIDLMRVRGFPFCQEVVDFIDAHDTVFIVEQNRDAQLRTLVINECDINPAKLIPVLHYDGTPVTAAFISEGIAINLQPVQQRLKEAV